MAGPTAWAVAALVAAVAAGGVLLIDDDTGQLVFLIGLAVVLVAGGALMESRRRGGAESAPRRLDWGFLIPVLLALAVSRLFGSEDARLAALFALAVAFSYAWERLRRMRPRQS